MVWNKQNPYLAELLSAKCLSGKKSNKEIMHYEISLGRSGIRYEPGDSLGVIPLNNHNLVIGIIDRLGINPSTTIEGYQNTVYDLLKSQFEILTPTNRLISYISQNINHKELEECLKNEDRTLLFKFKYGMDVLDFLNLDNNLKIDLKIFLTLLKPLQHRAYSISSSILEYPNKIYLTVSTQRWKKTSKKYGGVCTTFLADELTKGSKIKVFLIPNRTFKLPKDTSKSIIMIGPGTGIAPFISFLHERKLLKSSGKNWLFFGAQTKKDDFIYENELVDLQKNKVLDKLDLAFSQDQVKKIYVQDKMYESKLEFFKWIDEGAYLYVCGDALNMAKDVESMLHKIIQECHNCDSKESGLYIKNLKKEKRYLQDVY